jgi:uncharacterized glyoxalase superfamily protein PhnB
MLKLAVLLLHVSNSAAALDFYCNRLGFRHEFSHRADDTKSDPCYSGVRATAFGGIRFIRQ